MYIEVKSKILLRGGGPSHPYPYRDMGKRVEGTRGSETLGSRPKRFVFWGCSPSKTFDFTRGKHSPQTSQLFKTKSFNKVLASNTPGVYPDQSLELVLSTLHSLPIPSFGYG